MFKTINDINWSCIKQANDFAVQVPETLYALISGELAEEENAYWKLDNNVVLQGDLYESAFYILPFLYEILNSAVINGRNRVYDLLFEIANGYGVDDVLCNLNGRELPLTEACRQSVIMQKDLFLAEVFNKESSYRNNALELLVSLNEVADELKQELLLLLTTENSESFRQLLKEALEEL